MLADPAWTVQMLLASPYYAPERPVALYTWTDAMALPVTRGHLRGVLDELAAREVGNPLVLITKCHVPDEVIAELVETRRRVPVIVYLSLSGLDSTVERRVRHMELLDNFPRLAAAGIPIVHYWRPGTPASATPAVMSTVLGHAAAHAACTMAAGLKVEPAALPRLATMWPELATTDGVTSAEGVYPRAFWEFIHGTRERHPSYPLFHTNSCALAFVLGHPDTFGVFGGSTCLRRNQCPVQQRNRCGAAGTDRARLNEAQVRVTLRRWGLGEVAFTLSDDGRDITVGAAVDTATAAALTHELHTRVHVDRDHADGYWNSGNRGRPPPDRRMTATDLTPVQLDAMLAHTWRLRARFSATADREWDAATAATELAVQLGHLAECVRRADLGEPVAIDEQRPIIDPGDELADVLLAALSVWTLSAAPPRDPELHQALHSSSPESAPADRPTALLRLVDVAGALAEIAMVETGLRHRPGGAVLPLPGAVADVVRGCVAFARSGDLDPAAEFERMTRDADAFLASAHPVTAQSGKFSRHERDGAHVTKRLEADHLTGRELPLPPGPAGADELRRYLATLRAAEVRLPADLAVGRGTALTVAYTWLDGPTLVEAAVSEPVNVANAVHEVVGWVRALDGTNARIDTNLANFFLTGGRPTLVDVLPPLIVSRRPAARNLFEELFDSLCFDTPVTLDALVAYATTRLLITGGPDGLAAAGSLAGLAEELLQRPARPGLAASWFRARLQLATRCAAGQARVIQLRTFSVATSVLAFHRLDEQARHARTAAVRRHIRDLGLESA